MGVEALPDSHDEVILSAQEVSRIKLDIPNGAEEEENGIKPANGALFEKKILSFSSVSPPPKKNSRNIVPGTVLCIINILFNSHNRNVYYLCFIDEKSKT